MNTQMQTALAAWTLFSLLNQSAGEIDGFRHVENKIEEVRYRLVPGYNQAYVEQNMKIELDEQIDGRYVWKLKLPQDIKLIEDVVNDRHQHEWLIQATRAGRYKVIADYVDKKRMSRIKKRVFFEIEVLPCPCSFYSNKNQNTTK